MKKGQATLFVILGIGIILIVGLVVYFRGEIFGELLEEEIVAEITLPEQAQDYYDAVEECADWATEVTVLNLGLQGGYYEVPEPYHDAVTFRMPYYIYEGRITNIPTEDVYREQFALAFEEPFLACIRGFEENETLVIDERSFVYETELVAGGVVVNIVAPVTVVYENRTYSFEDFSIRKNIDVQETLAFVEGIVDAHAVDYNAIPYSDLLDLFIGTNVTLELNRDNETVTYSIVYQNSTLNNVDYRFNFLAKYEWIEE